MLGYALGRYADGYKKMLIRLRLLLWMGLFASVSQAGTIQYEVSPLGGDVFQYSYYLSDFVLQANQEIDIRFDRALYGSLSNGVAGADFLVLIFQPDNPPGVNGDYSALAVINNPSLAGPFRVDFLFTGSGLPGGQPFLVNQYDPVHNFLYTLESGTTMARAAEIPEPGSFSLCGVALVVSGLWTVRRRSRRNIR